MCGIIAIVRRRTQRSNPSATRVRSLLEGVPDTAPTDLQEIQQLLESLDLLENETSGMPGTITFLENPELISLLIEKCEGIEAAIGDFESSLDHNDYVLQDIEKTNACIIQAKDLIWTLSNDRVRLVESVRELSQEDRQEGLVETCITIHEALSALDRLEVRGRDSAGLHLMIRDHALDLNDPMISSQNQDRTNKFCL